MYGPNSFVLERYLAQIIDTIFLLFLVVMRISGVVGYSWICWVQINHSKGMYKSWILYSPVYSFMQNIWFWFNFIPC